MIRLQIQIGFSFELASDADREQAVSELKQFYALYQQQLQKQLVKEGEELAQLLHNQQLVGSELILKTQ